MAKTGASTGSVSISPARARRQAKARKREEQRWARKCGPVTVRFDPSVIRPKTTDA